MSGNLYVGINTPQAFQLTVTSASLDLTTVTAASLQVTQPGGTIATWTATIVSASATSMVCQHIHASGDVPRVGNYTVRAMLTTAAGVVPSKPVSTPVTY